MIECLEKTYIPPKTAAKIKIRVNKVNNSTITGNRAFLIENPEVEKFIKDKNLLVESIVKTNRKGECFAIAFNPTEFCNEINRHEIVGKAESTKSFEMCDLAEMRRADMKVAELRVKTPRTKEEIRRILDLLDLNHLPKDEKVIYMTLIRSSACDAEPCRRATAEQENSIGM